MIEDIYDEDGNMTEEAKQRLHDYLESQPFPHFYPYGKLLRRVEENGYEEIGYFDGRLWIPIIEDQEL